jgi:hypothetical protein
MQDRRHRPGDVLDDYCPRERRITDHAIVAMIDDEIRQTRCGSCDAEHEYKGGKVPPPRRKTPPPALFTQVLDNLNGSTPRPQAAAAAATEPVINTPQQVVPEQPPMAALAVAEPASPVVLEAPAPVAMAAAAAAADAGEEQPGNDDSRDFGGFRRSLIRATFPRPEGQLPPPRALPEFTIQSLQNRRNNNQRNAGGPNKFRGGGGGAGGRRRPVGQQDNLGPMRFRDGGHGQSQNGEGRAQGPPAGGGRRRRGGKKNR